jgi:flagellar protein FlaJ
MKDIQLIVNKILELVSEVETYSFSKKRLLESLDKIFKEYQKGNFTYFEYEQTTKKLLKGKTKEEWLNYYNAYILSLLKRIETYNSEIFYELYNAEKRPFGEPTRAREGEALKQRKTEQTKPAVSEHITARPTQIAAEKEKTTIRTKTPDSAKIKEEDIHLVEIKPSIIDRITIFFKHIFAKKEIEESLEDIREERLRERHGAKEGFASEREKIIRPKLKKKIFSVLWKKEKPTEAEKVKKEVTIEGFQTDKEGIEFGKIFGIDYLKNLLSRKQKVEYSQKEAEIPLSTLQLETLRRRTRPEIKAQIEKITETALTKEAKRIKAIMEGRRALKIYQPSFFGSLANLMIKKISLFLLDNFPGFFNDMYHALRLANIKVLSNTYVNMMVLGVLGSMLLSLTLFGFFFSFSALTGAQIIFRTLMMTLLAGLATFAGFYAYPYSKLKQRRRSINANLSFAINHMAAVSSSGVEPVRMFKLISQSKEYGEVSVEIEKVVNYVEVFGYDILTALRSVAATTPSQQFNDFLKGMISNTQTGGDIKSYFSQKAEEAMVNYKLERKKYTETISTYSDIYTGILIAAPLFFVTALSLVSMLGGKVASIDVDVLVVVGTYMAIPVLNVAFLMFLELTQPEI